MVSGEICIRAHLGEKGPAMWGITGRGVRLGEGKRLGRAIQIGLVKIAVRGPVEHAVLDVSGELDFAHTEELLSFVEDLPHRIMSIEVTGLEFIDSAGVRVLEQISSERESLHGHRPEVTGARNAVARTMRYVGRLDARLLSGQAT